MPASTDVSTLALVLVNYGSHALLGRNLDEGLRAAGIEVVVVDNHTTDEELASLRALADERGWHVVANPTNVGFGDAVNQGVAAARGLGCDSFVALNPDAQVSIPVLQELHAAVLQDRHALVCPRMNRSDGRHYFRGSMVNYSTGRIQGGWPEQGTAPAGEEWKPWLTAACLAFHAEAWDVVGGFSGGYFLYWEDVDFSRRAAEAGLRLVLRPDLVAIHDEGGTQESATDRALSSTYYYWNTRNRLLFAAQHLDRKDLARWIVRTPAESRQIFLRGGRRQLLASRDGLKASLRGTAAGLGLAGTALLRGRGAVQGQTTKESPMNAKRAQDLRCVLIAHPSPDLYGSDRVMLETVSGLVDAGVRVVVALPEHGPLVPAVEERGGEVVFIEMPVLRKSALKPKGFAELVQVALRTLPLQLKLARSLEADLVLVNTVTIPMWNLVGRLARRPVLVHVHEAEASASMLTKRVLYAPMLLASRLVLNSQFSTDVLTGAYPMLKKKCSVVYNGVPGPDAVEAPREDPSPVELLFIGRLSPRKGPDVAVDALAELVRRGVDARLGLLGAVFPGYEWFEQQLRDQVERLGLSERVDFLGFHPSVWPLMADRDIVLVPSTGDEPFGNTAVEAVLAARPLVVSDSTGLREAASGFQAVRRVPPKDPRAIADGVCDLLDNWGEVREQILEDRADAQRRYGPQQYGHSMLELVRSMVSRGGNAR